MEQVDDNLGAADLELTNSELEKLDAISALAPEYPGWMYDFLKPLAADLNYQFLALSKIQLAVLLPISAIQSFLAGVPLL